MSEETKIIIGWCLRCRDKREIKNIEETVTINKRKAVKGICCECGAKMFKFLRKIDVG